MDIAHKLLENMDITVGFVVAMTLGTICTLMFMEWLALGAFVSACIYMEKFFVRIRPGRPARHDPESFRKWFP